MAERQSEGIVWKFMAEDNCKRHAAYLFSGKTTERSEIEYAARMYKHKRTKTVSDNELS